MTVFCSLVYSTFNFCIEKLPNFNKILKNPNIIGHSSIQEKMTISDWASRWKNMYKRHNTGDMVWSEMQTHVWRYLKIPSNDRNDALK